MQGSNITIGIAFLAGLASFLSPCVLPLVPLKNILVITNEIQAPEVRKQLPKLPKQNVVAEPVGRDTCPQDGKVRSRARATRACHF